MSENAKNHRLEDILLYEQNLLEDDERRELEEHMRDCAECQASLATAKRYLPLLHEALKPNEPSAEELLARAKAQMRDKERAKPERTKPERMKEERATKGPAWMVRRVRVAMVGFGLAAASTAFIAEQVIMRSAGPAIVAHGDADAGAEGKTVAAPHRQPRADGGADGGVGKTGEEKVP